MDTTTLYIAFYSTIDEGKIHWSMILPENGSLSGSVQSYDIKQTATVWTFCDQEVTLGESSSLVVGCIRLPTIKAPFATIDEQFSASQATQGDTDLPHTHLSLQPPQMLG